MLFARLGEWLTWKACSEHIVSWNCLTDLWVGEWDYVTLGLKIPVLLIHNCGLWIEFAGPYALATKGRESTVKPSDSRKEVYEGELHA